MSTTKLLLFFFLLCQYFSCKEVKREIVIATYTYADNTRVENLQPFGNYLEEKLSRSVKVQSFPTVKALIHQIQAGNVDLAFINTFGYLLLKADTILNIQPLVTLESPKDSHSNYQTVIVTRKELGINNLRDLKHQASQQTFSFVNKRSTSGNLVPRLMLSSVGIANPEASFKEVIFSGNHARTLQLVRQKAVDFGAFGSAEYYKAIEIDSAVRKDLQLVAISTEIPLGPVIFNPNLPKNLQAKIQETLLNLHLENTEAFNQIKGGWTEAKSAKRYIKITDKYYNNFRSLSGNESDLVQILDQYLN